jgi:uncharacterized protein (TIRG00374 family)
MSKTIGKLLLSVVISALLIYWLFQQGFQVLPSLSDISRSTVVWAIPLYVALFVIFHILRAWRWIYLIRPFAKVRFSTMMEVAFVGFVAIQMMPLRTGEAARPYLLDRYAGISKSALFGTIAIERVIDGLMVSLILTGALFAIPASRSPFIWGLRLIPSAVFIAALVLLVAFYYRPFLVNRGISKLCGFFSEKLAQFVIGVLDRFHTGLKALPSRGDFWAFTWMTFLYWLINGVSFYYLALGCGVDIPMTGALAGMGCLAVGILLPAGPGYFGNFQVAVLAAVDIYIPSGAASTNIAVFVFLLYVLQTGLTIVFGGVSALTIRKKPRLSRPPHSVTASLP